MKKKSVGLADYKKELDKWFSIYIRLRDKGVCISCGKVDYWKRMQNGHYVSRVWLPTRFDERNCNVQCSACNIFRNGNMDEYTLAIQRKHGTKILAELNKLKYKQVKYDIPWYVAKIEHYKGEAKKLGYC